MLSLADRRVKELNLKILFSDLEKVNGNNNNLSESRKEEDLKPLIDIKKDDLKPLIVSLPRTRVATNIFRIFQGPSFMGKVKVKIEVL